MIYFFNHKNKIRRKGNYSQVSTKRYKKKLFYTVIEILFKRGKFILTEINTENLAQIFKNQKEWYKEGWKTRPVFYNNSLYLTLHKNKSILWNESKKACSKIKNDKELESIIKNLIIKQNRKDDLQKYIFEKHFITIYSMEFCLI